MSSEETAIDSGGPEPKGYCDILISTDGSTFYLLDTVEWDGDIHRVALPLDRMPGVALIAWDKKTLEGADMPPGMTIAGNFFGFW